MRDHSQGWKGWSWNQGYLAEGKRGGQQRERPENPFLVVLSRLVRVSRNCVTPLGFHPIVFQKEFEQLMLKDKW